jgi:hypothetical protein
VEPAVALDLIPIIIPLRRKGMKESPNDKRKTRANVAKALADVPIDN